MPFVPILYVYPKEGPLGSVGEIAVNSVTGELSAHPPIEEIKRLPLDLYRVNVAKTPPFYPQETDLSCGPGFGRLSLTEFQAAFIVATASA